MAQTNYTPISLYYSTTAAAVPVNTNLVNGELALNITDGKLYYKDNTGTVQLLASKNAASGVAGSNTQIQFNNSGAFGASANLTWNGTVLSTTGFTASSDSSFTSTGALLISKGTTAQQPGTPAVGMLRYNTTTNSFEGYSGSSPAWNPVGGATISNDTTTATYEYPVFASTTSGSATTLYTSNANYLYKPSTGDLQANQLIASNGFVLNATTMTASYTIPAGQSASSVGGTSGFVIPSGMTVTVSSGSRWVVL